jgi:hypothetical protein
MTARRRRKDFLSLMAGRDSREVDETIRRRGLIIDGGRCPSNLGNL